jgi:hypothetical protein
MLLEPRTQAIAGDETDTFWYVNRARDLPRGRQIPMPLTSSVGHPKRDLYVNIADVRENDDSVRGSVRC